MCGVGGGVMGGGGDGGGGGGENAYAANPVHLWES